MDAFILISGDIKALIGLHYIYIHLLTALHFSDITDGKVMDPGNVFPCLKECIKDPCHITGIIDMVIVIELGIIGIFGDNRLTFQYLFGGKRSKLRTPCTEYEKVSLHDRFC